MLPKENALRLGFMLDALLATLDPKRGAAWHGGPTPMLALRGVSAAQARWVPARRRHSIWELALHIAYWDYAVRRRLDPDTPRDFPRSPANWPALPERPHRRWYCEPVGHITHVVVSVKRRARSPLPSQGMSRSPVASFQ